VDASNRREASGGRLLRFTGACIRVAPLRGADIS
jgi:hypothetical protein